MSHIELRRISSARKNQQRVVNFCVGTEGAGNTTVRIGTSQRQRGCSLLAAHLWVVTSSEAFVEADQLTMHWKTREERAWNGLAFEDNVISALLVKIMPELQPTRTSSNNAVCVRVLQRQLRR